MVTNRITLTSVAMLKVDLDTRTRDYIDYLKPFIMHILASFPSSSFSIKEIGDNIYKEFGIQLPFRIVELLLARISRDGYLKKSYGIYHIKKAIPPSNITLRRTKANRHINNVIESLCRFVLIEFGQKWTTDEATSALIDFLSQFSVDCLRSYTHGTALPETPGDESKTKFVVGSFVRRAYDSDPTTFESIIIILKGYMLSNALYCSDLASLQKKFSSVIFYLDTPVIISLLNLQGSEKCRIETELLELVRHLNGNVAIFWHTLEEVTNVIKWCEDHIEDPRASGPIIKEMRRLGHKPSDLLLIRNRLEEELERLGISKYPAPKYGIEFQIDEEALQKAIEEEIHYMNPKALLYDINSIRSIYALRKGLCPSSLEDSQVVLVTSNVALAKKAFSFGKEYDSTREVSPVISTISLANIAWLKAPLGAPDLPIKELLAVCYAAMEPPRKLWIEYSQEIEKLRNQRKITAEDHAVLRLTELAKSELMRKTLGTQGVLTQDTVLSILARAKEEHAKKDREAYEIEKRAHDATLNERNRLIAEQNETKKRVYWKIKKQGSVLKNIIRLTLILLVLVSGIFSPLATSSYIKSSYVLTAATQTAALFLLVWGILDLCFRLNPKSVASIIEKRYVLSKLKKWGKQLYDDPEAIANMWKPPGIA